MDGLVEVVRRRIWRWIGRNGQWSAIAGAVAVLVGVGAIQLEHDGTPDEGPARLLAARLDQGQLEVLVELAGCHLEIRVTAVESADEVEARALAQRHESDLACAAVVSSAWTRVRLRDRLASRHVVDGWSGDRVPLVDCGARTPDRRCRGGPGAVSSR
jgi:hypothetical protein